MITTSLPDLINAWGTPTPFGVSRSSPKVADAAAHALLRHVDMEALQRLVAAQASTLAGTEAACFCHSAAGAITLAVAGALSGTDFGIVGELPRRDELGVVAIQAEHCVNYGQSVVQAIRLAGARVAVVHGTSAERIQALHNLAAEGKLRAVLYVDSVLVKEEAPLNRAQLFSFSRSAKCKLIVDAAAQDWRLNDHTANQEADVTIYSAQKYLAAPTCGILVGNHESIASAEANLKGIGRAMKPTKEALSGVSAALEERSWSSLPQTKKHNTDRATRFAERMQKACEIECAVTQSEHYGPFPRVMLKFASDSFARQVGDTLFKDERVIVIGRALIDHGILTVELSHVTAEEEEYLFHRICEVARGLHSARC